MENNEITFYLDSIAHAKIKNDQESFHMSPTVKPQTLPI